MLAEWFDFLTTKGGIGGNGRREAAMDVDMFIYLRTSPEVAYQRVQERARKEEEVRVDKTTTLMFRLNQIFDYPGCPP